MSGGAVFVDRDGTINQLVPDRVSGQPESPLDPHEVELLPGAGEALVRLVAAGWLLVGVSNQPAAAKGMVTLDQLRAVQKRVLQLLASEGARLDDFQLCFHHPQGTVPGLTMDCDCRKPRPGMLLRAAALLNIDLGASWMVGDTEADVLAGAAAACRTVLVETPGSGHKRVRETAANLVVADLSEAADAILATRESGASAGLG